MSGVTIGGSASPISVVVVGGPIQYYTAYASTNIYVEKVFGACHTITIQNTHASDPVKFSFDGLTLHGDLSGGESITVNVGTSTSIYLKSTGGTATIRIWGW
jgi:hypothetical protein